MRRMRNSLFIKIMAAFVAVVIPLYVFGLVLNQKGSSSVRGEIATVMRTKVMYDMNTMEAELNRLIDLQNRLMTDNDLMFLAVANDILSEIDRRAAILRLQDKLQTIQNSSRFIREAAAYIPSIDRKISSDRPIDNLDQETFAGLLREDREKKGNIVLWNSGLYIAKKEPELGTDSAPVVLLTLELSRSAMASELMKFRGDYDGGMLLLDNSYHWSIVQGTDADGISPSLILALGRLAREPQREGLRTIEADGKRYLVALRKSEELGMTLFQFMPETEVLGPLRQYRSWLWGLTALSLVVLLLYSFWMNRLIRQPFRKLIVAFRTLERGNLKLDIKHKGNDEFSFLYGQFNKMVKRLEASIQDVYVHKYRAQNAELKQLQSQINPHFLYNSFFTLGRMIKLQDYDSLMPFANHLGEYFRFITRDMKEEIPLEEEANFSRSYAEIQNVRFQNRIQASFGEVPEEARELPVPRLILQPIIENAYKHGLENRSADGRVSVEFRLEADRLVIVVEDNGEQVDRAAVARMERALFDRREGLESTGMINVHRRLQLRFGMDAGLQLSGGSMGGLRVDIVIPLGREAPHVQNHDRG